MVKIFFYLLSLGLNLSVLAQVPQDLAQIKWFSSQNHISAGEKVPLILQFKLAKGWHIYWKNPGEVGQPPKLTVLQKTKKTELSEIQFPTPDRIPFKSQMNFGYENQVEFYQELQGKDGLSSQTKIELEAELRYLICKDSCIPQKQKIKLEQANASEIQFFQNPSYEFPQRISLENYTQEENKVYLFFKSRNFDSKPIDFIPGSTLGIDVHSKPIIQQDLKSGLTEIQLEQVTSQQVLDLAQFEGVIKTKSKSYEFLKVQKAETQSNLTPDNEVLNFSSLLLMILFAFIGGIILNLMPCVLPVLTLKFFSILKAKELQLKNLKNEAYAYTLGVLSSLWLLALVLILLRAGGKSIGWGFQLQSPVFVLLLSILFVVLGLNMLGIIEFGSQWSQIGDQLTRKQGFKGSFFTGVLTTLAATPCSAPFLGTALGVALTQSALTSFLIFTAMGLGLASPYLGVAFYPGSIRYFPKPGAWMNTFKKLLSIPLFVTALWLGSVSYTLIKPKDNQTHSLTPPFQRWSKLAIDQALKENKKIFVNFTADWCVTCKVNEKFVFKNSKVIEALSAKHVIALEGDWTHEDPEITKALENHGRNSVPTYLLYDAQNPKGKILPQVLTPESLIEYLR